MLRTHPTRDGGVSLCFGNKMPEEGVGSQKPQADVCRLSKLPQGVREGKIFCTWTTIYQGYNNLKKEKKEEKRKTGTPKGSPLSKCSNKTLKVTYAPKAPGSQRNPWMC